MEAIDWPLQFQRQFDKPLDKDQAFDNTTERLEYLSSARRYPGQIMGDVEANRAFMVNREADGYVPLAPLVVGSVQLFAGPQPPSGWMWCDGSNLQIAEHKELFDAIETIYGGDGSTNFNIPDLMSLGPHSQVNYIICATGIRPTE